MNTNSSSLSLCNGRRSRLRHVLLLNYKPCSEEVPYRKSTVSNAFNKKDNGDAEKNSEVSNNRCKRRHGEQLSSGSNGNAWNHESEAKQSVNCRNMRCPPFAPPLQNDTTTPQSVHSIYYGNHPQNAMISDSQNFQQHCMMTMPLGGNQHQIANQYHPHATTPIHQQAISSNHPYHPSTHQSNIPWQSNLYPGHMFSIPHQQPQGIGGTWNHSYPTNVQHQHPPFQPTVGHHLLTNFAPSHSHLGHFHPVNSLMPPQSTNSNVHVTQSKQDSVDNISVDCCHVNLNPAPIPFNPLDDDDDGNVNAGEQMNQIEKECAWLVEETSFLLPFLHNEIQTATSTTGASTTGANSEITTATHATNSATHEHSNSSVLLFDLAWLFGSLELRTILFRRNPALVTNKLNDSEMTVEGLCKRYCHLNNTDDTNGTLSKNNDTLLMYVHSILSSMPDEHVTRRFHRQREEARAGLKLGYRRSESIGQIFDSVRRFRLRKVLEERGDAVDDEIFERLVAKKNRRRRKRKEEFVAGGDVSRLTLRELERIALQKPIELTDLEEETAWLCEESLLLPPKKSDASNQVNERYEVSVSAGLLTEALNVDWTYVIENASQNLKVELRKVRGHMSNRTLQRIVRHSNIHVRMAFFKRRKEIANLIVIGGYRRASTNEVLPSHEELILSGFLDILKTKLMRRMQKCPKSVDLVSTRELRRACNRRLGDKCSAPSKASQTKRAGRPPSIEKSCLHHATNKRLMGPLQSVSCVKKARLSEREQDCSNTMSISETQRSSILTLNEEEIAWLREEFEIETGGLKGFDWEYIEKYSTNRLRQEMLRRGVLYSLFPTVCGVSKLKAMVRIDNSKVNDAFHRKRRDIRCAIKNGFRRDLRNDILPDIPQAPERIAGTRVMDVELAEEDDQAEGTGSGYGSGQTSRDGSADFSCDAGANVKLETIAFLPDSSDSRTY
eukprot:CCRYP_006816-RA/>CCRYP_006816-RA protein AED:0.02 eAED:0.02 QI:63/1/1/1/1/1/2/427/951